MKTFQLTSILCLFNLIQLASAQDIKIHAPHAESFACTEHWDGQFKYLGDALGTDCVIQDWYKDESRMFMRSYKNQGFNNKDWFGFKKNVLAPCDCEVVAIHINDKTNQPGIMNPGRASSIAFKTPNGEHVLIAHVREVEVELNDQVKAGQVVAKVGNNGYSRNPHVHIAAWNSKNEPLQIQFDQKTIGLKSQKLLKIDLE